MPSDPMSAVTSILFLGILAILETAEKEQLEAASVEHAG